MMFIGVSNPKDETYFHYHKFDDGGEKTQFSGRVYVPGT